MTSWPPRRVRVEARSFAWAGIDQVLSSLSNVIVSLGVIRAGGTSALGRYAVAFSIYLVVLGFQRALIAEPMLCIPRVDNGGSDRVEASKALGSSLLFATGCAVAIGISGVVLHAETFIVLAVSLPLLCGQDLLRYVAMWRYKASEACIMDGAWVIASVLALPLLRSVSTASAVALWAVGAAVGLVLGIHRLDVRPSWPRASVQWWMANGRRLGGLLAIESVVYTVSTQLAVLAIALTAGEGALGALRSVQIILAPAALLIVALNLFLLPRFVEYRPPPRIVVAAMVGAGVLALCVTSGTLALPRSLIQRVLSANGAWTFSLAVPISLQVVLTAMGSVVAACLKASRRGGLVVGTRFLSAVLGTPLVVWLAASFGIAAAAWGLAGQAGLHTLLSLVALLRSRSSVAPVKTEGRVPAAVGSNVPDPSR